LWYEVIFIAVCRGNHELVSEVARPAILDFLLFHFQVNFSEHQLANIITAMRLARGLVVGSAELGLNSEHAMLRGQAILVLAKLESPPETSEMLAAVLDKVLKLGWTKRLVRTSLFMNAESYLPIFLAELPLGVFAREIATIIMAGAPVHAGLLVHRRMGTHAAFCGIDSSLLILRQFLQSVTEVSEQGREDTVPTGTRDLCWQAMIRLGAAV
jgi:hypothetical protein